MKKTLEQILSDKHLHWKIVGYEKMNDNGVLWDTVEIQLVGDTSEEDAMERAKKILKRQNYRLQNVWECTTCRFQDDMAKMFKRMTDKME